MTWSFSVSDRIVFLTFDDGPNPEITEYYLRRLKELGWKATFFCVGQNVRKHPKIFQQIIEDGHTVGNHTFSHVNGWKTSDEVYMKDVLHANKCFSSTLFRPPYGKMRKSQIAELSKEFHIIMWSFMTYDFDVNASLSKLNSKFKKIQPGMILVHHDNEKFIENEKLVFEHTVDYLLANGFSSQKISL